MSTLYVIREQIVECYEKFGKWINILFRFVFSLMVLFYLNSTIGYMSMLTKGIVILAIALICSILPLSALILVAAVIIILHTYTISMVIAAAISIVFLLMFILYFRFTSNEVLFLLLTPLAFIFNMPFVIPVAFGLLGSSMTMIPVAFGTIVYYMIEYLKSLGEVATGSDKAGMIEQVLNFANTMLKNKEMWAIILILTVGVIVVNSVKKLAIDHSWKFASCAGIASNLIVTLFCSIVLDINIKIMVVILGSCVAVILGIVIEFMFLNIDYSRTENIEFEDDEYHYYVKAVPKISIGKPIKTIKHINDVEGKPIPLKHQSSYGNQDTTVLPTRDVEYSSDTQGNRQRSASNARRQMHYEQDHQKANYQLLKDNINTEIDG